MGCADTLPDMEEEPLNNKAKKILVIGASSGIGYECAIYAASLGHNVLAVARREDRLKDLAAQSNLISYAKCDVTKEEDVKTVFASAGDVDIVIYSAGEGFNPDIPLEDVTDEDLDKNYNVFVKGTTYAAKAAKSLFKDKNLGVFSTIASRAGISTDVLGRRAPYSAGKKAQVAISQTLHEEAREEGLRISSQAFCPGLVPGTGMVEAGEGGTTPERTAKLIVDQSLETFELLLSGTDKEVKKFNEKFRLYRIEDGKLERVSIKLALVIPA